MLVEGWVRIFVVDCYIRGYGCRPSFILSARPTPLSGDFPIDTNNSRTQRSTTALDRALTAHLYMINQAEVIPIGGQFAFRLQQVELGRDIRREATTSITPQVWLSKAVQRIILEGFSIDGDVDATSV
jgi:hypothetical protein